MTISCSLNICHGYNSLSAALYDPVVRSFAEDTPPPLRKRVTTVLAFIPLSLLGAIETIVRFPLALLGKLVVKYMNIPENTLIHRVYKFISDGCVESIDVAVKSIRSIKAIVKGYELSASDDVVNKNK